MLSLKDLNLRFNPFEKQVVYDYEDFISQPFLLTETLKMLKLGVTLNLQSESSLYYVILGERGSGKTTALMFLKDVVEHGGNERCIAKYERSIRGMGSYSGLVAKLLPDSRPIYREETSSALGTLKGYLYGKKYYWFIDVPDMIARQEMEVMLRGLELLLGFKNISVIIAMNRSHYDRSFDYSEILGKFMVFQLRPFSLEECEELITKRIENASDGEPRLRFTENAIAKINEITKGIPRNIISACSSILLKYMQETDEIVEIDEEFVARVLSGSYARKILDERVKPPLRENLWKLYTFIKTEFNGRVDNETKLAATCYEKFGMSRSTLRRRLVKLEKLGLITIRKSEKNMWSNVIEVAV